LVIILLYLAM